MHSGISNMIIRAVVMVIIIMINGFGKMSDEEIEKNVNQLLKKMTVEEKVGQMTQVTIQAVSAVKGTPTEDHKLDESKLEEAIVNYHVGSILNVYDVAYSIEHWHEIITQIQDIAVKKTRLGIPIIYGIDAIHGANYTKEAVLFPQSIAMAATWNTELVRKSGEITAFEVRASGIPWNFNPVLGVGRTPLWSRLFETYGEDPYTCSIMGAAYIKGLEGDNNDISAEDKVAACMKHYLGYSYPRSGKDRTTAWIPERMLRDIFLTPFKKAVEAGVHTVMVNSSDINGIPTHSNYYVLTEILRNELGFKGFVVSDWEDINHLYSRDKVAATRKEAVQMAVMAGVDMSMVPYDFSFYNDLLDLVNESEVPMSRVDEAVGRILRVKYKLNLFDKPYPNKKMKDTVGSSEFTNVSLQAAREAITLLKNTESFLPLNKNKKVLVTGPTANLLSVLNSGWTYTWQGNEESLYPKEKKTILEAIQDKIGQENVIYFSGASYDSLINIDGVVNATKNVDAAIICIGEYAYCETPGNIHDLSLPKAQLDLVAKVQKTGLPVALVLVEGRPRIITPVVKESKAILMAYLPGPEGGQAIADVLFGDFNPCGKLPITYPRSPNDLVCYDYQPNEIDDPNKMDPLFEFGHGLSYTTYEYSDLLLDKNETVENELINVSVVVKNTGDRAGKEVVHLYLSDLVRSTMPPVRQLKRFKGVTLQAGETKKIDFFLGKDDFGFHGRNNEYTVEGGEFKVSIANLSDTFTLNISEDRAEILR
jgi:beta-glucosidase